MITGRRSGFVTAVAAAVLLLTGCGDAGSATPAEPVGIVSVIADVDYYIGCANEPVTVAGTVWYPLAEFEFEDEVADIVDTDREPWPRRRGFAPRVAPPGPGDDVGTLVVYADGFAWYQSDSGQTIWLTEDEQTYRWVC